MMDNCRKQQQSGMQQRNLMLNKLPLVECSGGAAPQCAGVAHTMWHRLLLQTAVYHIRGAALLGGFELAAPK
jgi:hypothetical protein